jgi:YD repeat-containing protein
LGQLEALTKPSGKQWLHTYDSLGRLATYRASDNSFSYKYSYDRNDNLLTVYDLIHQTCTKKVYNIYGDLTSEVLGNGLETKYRYDDLGQPIHMTLSDQSAVRYRYCGSQLKQIDRLDPSGKVNYSHNYSLTTYLAT